MATPSREALDLLASQEKKLTVMVSPEIHNHIKSMAANNRTTIKELILEAYHEHLVPKYASKER